MRVRRTNFFIALRDLAAPSAAAECYLRGYGWARVAVPRRAFRDFRVLASSEQEMRIIAPQSIQMGRDR
jgi:hypothetical protein